MASIDTWGVTEKGFYRPTIDDIINEKNKKAKELFGEDFDTGELTPQGKFFRVNAAAESKLCEIAEDIYYSIFPSTARGISLDRVCGFVNLQRGNPGASSIKIKVYGTLDHIIEAGTEFKNGNGVHFYSSADAVINQTETNKETERYYTEVIVHCTESGTIGNVTNINSTVEVDPDISEIVYTSTEVYGTDLETDVDLRKKFSRVVQGLGTNTRDAIIANLLRLSEVDDVIIIDNISGEDMVISADLTISNGTYGIIVYSTDDTIQQKVAEAIFQKQPLGIPQSGIETVTVTDNSNTDHIVKFSFVEPEIITVNVSCLVDSSFQTEGIRAIEDNIVQYINSLGIGEEVVYTQLYNYIYDVIGVYKITELVLKIGTSDTPVKTDIPIEKIKVARPGKIIVTATGV